MKSIPEAAEGDECGYVAEARDRAGIYEVHFSEVESDPRRVLSRFERIIQVRPPINVELALKF